MLRLYRLKLDGSEAGVGGGVGGVQGKYILVYKS